MALAVTVVAVELVGVGMGTVTLLLLQVLLALALVAVVVARTSFIAKIGCVKSASLLEEEEEVLMVARLQSTQPKVVVRTKV